MSRLAQLIEDHRPRVLSMWQEEVRRRTTLAGARLDEVLDHLPEVLDFVLVRLDGDVPGHRSAAAVVHGRERFKASAGPAEVARELLGLPDVMRDLWREVEQGRELPAEEHLRLQEVVHEVLLASLEGWGAAVAADLEMLSAGLEQIPVGVVVLDADGRHLLANAEWERQTGLGRARALGRTSSEVWGTPESRAAEEAQLQAIRSGIGIPLQDYTQEEQGGRKHYRWGLAPLRDAGGAVRGAVAFTLETTEEVEARRHLEGLRSRMVAGLAHDVRNPLTAARLLAHGLGRRPEKDPAPVAARILASIDRADRMIQNMLDAGRLEGGARLAVTRQPDTDLEKVVADALEDLPDGDRARVRVHAAGGAPVVGAWDGEALRRVVWNLLTNALKHGDPDADVDVELARTDDEATLSVRNAGPAIPPEHREGLFEPWRRPDTEARGWGLGLFVVKALTEAHGGRIGLTSEPGDTRFTLTLPRTPSA